MKVTPGYTVLVQLYNKETKEKQNQENFLKLFNSHLLLLLHIYEQLEILHVVTALIKTQEDLCKISGRGKFHPSKRYPLQLIIFIPNTLLIHALNLLEFAQSLAGQPEFKELLRSLQ